MVFDENTAIYEAAKTLNINYSTAKFLCKQYQKKGTIAHRRNNANRQEA
jgi:transposase